MPLDQLHDQRLGLVGLFQAIDGRYVGVVQRGEDFGLALKPRQPDAERSFEVVFAPGHSIAHVEA